MNTRNVLSTSVMVALIGVPSMQSLAQSNWVRKANMPTGRSLVVAYVVDGKIYCTGGGAKSGVLYPALEQYDPATDTWTTNRTKMPTPRSGFDGGVVNGKIYAIGGGDSSGILSVVEEYDPATDVWTRKTPMPTARALFCCGVVEGKIYAIAGGPNVEAYDPATDTWTRKTNMPSPRIACSASTVNGVIYVVGGATDVGGAVLSTVFAYDPVADTWTSKASMRNARLFLSTCVLNGKIYAVGGCSDPYNGSEVSTVEGYDPATDTWWTSPSMQMQVKRKALGCAAVNGKIYAIGGISIAGWEPGLSTVEEYDPKPTLSFLRSGSTLKISWNGILESSDGADGSNWQALNLSTCPFTFWMVAPMKFYRARQP